MYDVSYEIWISYRFKYPDIFCHTYRRKNTGHIFRHLYQLHFTQWITYSVLRSVYLNSTIYCIVLRLQTTGYSFRLLNAYTWSSFYARPFKSYDEFSSSLSFGFKSRMISWFPLFCWKWEFVSQAIHHDVLSCECI